MSSGLSFEKMLTEFPDLDGWDYGDYPYGLETLTLPSPTEQDRLTAGASEDVAAVGEKLRLLARTPGSLHIDSLEYATALFWFRWITGHQVSFVIWRLLDRSTRRLSDAVHRDAVLAAMTTYVRGYSAMLLYTGSCSRQIYEQVIRLSMLLHHRWFSGIWAPDYEPVRNLLRGRRLPSGSGATLLNLSRAIEDCQQIHLGVAAKLVPGGRSFLQELGSAGQLKRARMEGAIYDRYFMTERAPVPSDIVTTQLLRRLVAITLDVSANGLNPSTSGGDDEIPPELLTPEADDYRRTFPAVLLEVAQCATA